ncbi:hypothetical protein RUMLAC_01299 [[Ruminococcus] lactaris ATCC 29176]|uniref:Uncharacterized protein n=1 Tax=[Ruminococcus] lactaris ATCC 29176 TaxID=471875 RepID=B5CPA8_9FIRM|nr:hypothetical protein RUMLAC_01299 [[Ruminococcus] lactaris ATCC 29176]
MESFVGIVKISPTLPWNISHCNRKIFQRIFYTAATVRFCRYRLDFLTDRMAAGFRDRTAAVAAMSGLTGTVLVYLILINWQ